jgi:hypothetical protein
LSFILFIIRVTKYIKYLVNNLAIHFYREYGKY